MGEYSFLIGIALALLLGVMSPGPSFLVVSKVAVDQSRAQALAVAAGLATGAGTLALVAAMGLYVILESVPWLYKIFKVLGGLYLCYLAYKIWRSADAPTEDSVAPAVQAGFFKAYMTGLITQLSNPKTAIIIGGIFAAFLPAQLPDYSIAIGVILAFVIDGTWYCLVALALSTRKAQRAYNRSKANISKAAGGFMAFMGLKLALGSD
jgi:threonine/homoserine/homoserine lactone efflux protein